MPGHGSLHFCWIHAKWLGHSELLIHSGLQFGGVPIYSWRHEQDGLPLMSLHWEYGPQGDGWQGLLGTIFSTGSKKI